MNRPIRLKVDVSKKQVVFSAADGSGEELSGSFTNINKLHYFIEFKGSSAASFDEFKIISGEVHACLVNAISYDEDAALTSFGKARHKEISDLLNEDEEDVELPLRNEEEITEEESVASKINDEFELEEESLIEEASSVEETLSSEEESYVEDLFKEGGKGYLAEEEESHIRAKRGLKLLREATEVSLAAEEQLNNEAQLAEEDKLILEDQPLVEQLLAVEEQPATVSYLMIGQQLASKEQKTQNERSRLEEKTYREEYSLGEEQQALEEQLVTAESLVSKEQLLAAEGAQNLEEQLDSEIQTDIQKQHAVQEIGELSLESQYVESELALGSAFESFTVEAVQQSFETKKEENEHQKQFESVEEHALEHMEEQLELSTDLYRAESEQKAVSTPSSLRGSFRGLSAYDSNNIKRADVSEKTDRESAQDFGGTESQYLLSPENSRSVDSLVQTMLTPSSEENVIKDISEERALSEDASKAIIEVKDIAVKESCQESNFEEADQENDILSETLPKQDLLNNTPSEIDISTEETLTGNIRVVDHFSKDILKESVEENDASRQDDPKRDIVDDENDYEISKGTTLKGTGQEEHFARNDTEADSAFWRCKANCFYLLQINRNMSIIEPTLNEIQGFSYAITAAKQVLKEKENNQLDTTAEPPRNDAERIMYEYVEVANTQYADETIPHPLKVQSSVLLAVIDSITAYTYGDDWTTIEESMRLYALLESLWKDYIRVEQPYANRYHMLEKARSDAELAIARDC